ncbi:MULTISPECIES: bifunctional diaminohydroxyphosphoribosylaminopyrimidine deaminase/5-amino-6-(5-phosphoribosylamino)uracil reductase RibD [Synergistales]|nr:bifunctional diaminohydroxyphosphoribosylaminopyrimidine deaminase/5-amino-6-(5-phosphoribosylamino)uracil reductase RibD [Aminithiophilus ramosus]
MTRQMELYTHYMRMALSLAERGTGWTSPNPRVGCVIFDEKEERVLGWGYHRRFGGPHAEVKALERAGERARGATAVVNLEPCCHFGKTPPCAPRLVEAGVGRVVVGMRDPNPCVDGGGIEILRKAGIDVVLGVLEEECLHVNRGFVKALTGGRPWVTVKAALSLDGAIALGDGESRWISGALSRSKAHLLRGENDAILVGIGTVLKDDPELTVRLVSGQSPLRVVLDSRLRTPACAKVIGDGRCLVVGTAESDPKRAETLRKAGAEVVLLDAPEGRFRLDELLSLLVRRGVLRLLVEGGASVIQSFIEERLVDEVSLFLAPKFLGRGIPFTGNLRLRHMGEAIALRAATIRQVDGDLWLEAMPCLPA